MILYVNLLDDPKNCEVHTFSKVWSFYASILLKESWFSQNISCYSSSAEEVTERKTNTQKATGPTSSGIEKTVPHGRCIEGGWCNRSNKHDKR